MAFDYGTSRIGVAIGQTVSRTAQSLSLVKARHGKPHWESITQMVADWRPDVFVIGTPYAADCQSHDLRPAIERFARQLRGRYRLPVEFIDERLSSAAAAADPEAASRALDAVAAKMILTSWLTQLELDTEAKG